MEGLIHGGAYFRNFTVFWNAMKEGVKFLMLGVFKTDFLFSDCVTFKQPSTDIERNIFSFVESTVEKN